jgi:hypothetical protein
VGYIGDNPAAELLNALSQQDSGGNAVGIEVAVHGDKLIAEQSAQDSGHRLIDIGETARVISQPFVSGKERLELSGVGYAAIMEQLDEQSANVRPDSRCHRVSGKRGANLPSLTGQP